MGLEPFDGWTRSLSGCLGPYDARLLPVCCPDAATLILGTTIRVVRPGPAASDLGAGDQPFLHRSV